MVELPDDERLATILASVGEHLIVDEADEAAAVTTVSPAEGRRRARRYRLAIAAAVVVAVVASALVVPPVRRAVARWLGIGTTQVRFGSEADGDPAGLPTLVTGAQVLTSSEAESLLGGPLPDTSATALGRAPRLARPHEGGVVMLWSQGATTLWVHRGAAPVEVYQKKLASPGNHVEVVADLGDGALLVTGEHVLVTPSRRLAARTVLLWTKGTIEYRLESDLAPSEMVAVARSIDS